MLGIKYNTIEFYNLKNYEEYSNFVDSLPENMRNMYLFFVSGKNEKGKGWCDYCQMAESLLRAYLSELKTDLTIAYVDVGDRDYWKNPACPFRTDDRTRLMVIPTLLKWKGVQRLEGSQCNKRDLLQMMFEDEDLV